jgi:hypothetical protein
MENDCHEYPKLRSAVFEEATLRGFGKCDDRYDRFRTAGVLDDLDFVSGTKYRAFTRKQEQRFFDLLTLCDQLRTKRPRASELAFWLCWNGATDVPPELVCEHIERTVLFVIQFIRREYNRRRVPLRSENDPERWRQAGLAWAKPLIRQFLAKRVGNGLLLDIVSTAVGLALRALVTGGSFKKAAPLLKRFAFLFGGGNVPIEAMRELWGMLQEGLTLFSLNKRSNPLLVAVREVVASDPRQIIGHVQDGRLACEVMAAVFPMYNVSGAPALPEGCENQKVSIHRMLPPGISAVLALIRNDPHAIDMREQLRNGNTEPALLQFRALGAARDLVLFRVRGEQAS